MPRLIDTKLCAMDFEKHERRDHGYEDTDEKNTDIDHRRHGKSIRLVDTIWRGAERQEGSQKDQCDLHDRRIREYDVIKDCYPCSILEEWYIFRQETIGDDADDDNADVEEIALPINVDQRLAFCHLDLLRHASCRQILFVIMAIHQVKNGKKDDHIHQKDRRQLECPCKGYASLESHEKRRITERRKTPAHIRHEENQEDHDVRNMPAPCIDADQRTDEQHRSSCRTDPARHKRPDKKDQRIRLRCARQTSVHHDAPRCREKAK